MAKLDLSALDDLFAKGKDFQLTDTQYEEKVKKPLPKDNRYIRKNSPLARMASEHGFTITEVLEQPLITRTVIFKKN